MPSHLPVFASSCSNFLLLLLLLLLLRRTLGFAALACGVVGCSRVDEPLPPALGAPSPPHTASAAQPSTSPAVVLGQRPHDPSAFTQGLVFVDSVFLESTGMYGASSLRRVDPDSGRVLRSVPLDSTLFGEGLALLHGELYQLTWREHRCLVYDAATFEKRREIAYEGEGWGLTTDGDSLVMSDGSAALRFLEPGAMRLIRKITVHDGARTLENLNELEWVHGEILANVWGRKVIARIDPSSGDVMSYIDLSGLPEPHHDNEDAVLNGIAYDQNDNRLFVTGKNWQSMFEIRPPTTTRPSVPGRADSDTR